MLHGVLKFRQQLCQCTRQTDGQTDCQPRCVCVCVYVHVTVAVYFLFIHLCFVSTCCCPVLSIAERHGGNESSDIFVKEKGRKEGIKHRFVVFTWFFSPSFRSLCPWQEMVCKRKGDVKDGERESSEGGKLKNRVREVIEKYVTGESLEWTGRKLKKVFKVQEKNRMAWGLFSCLI